eukprot:scaffold306_cov149-Amphora_coffeaeformis.AAC.4
MGCHVSLSFFQDQYGPLRSATFVVVAAAVVVVIAIIDIDVSKMRGYHVWQWFRAIQRTNLFLICRMIQY